MSLNISSTINDLMSCADSLPDAEATAGMKLSEACSAYADACRMKKQLKSVIDRVNERIERMGATIDGMMEDEGVDSIKSGDATVYRRRELTMRRENKDESPESVAADFMDAGLGNMLAPQYQTLLSMAREMMNEGDTWSIHNVHKLPEVVTRNYTFDEYTKVVAIGLS